MASRALALGDGGYGAYSKLKKVNIQEEREKAIKEARRLVEEEKERVLRLKAETEERRRRQHQLQLQKKAEEQREREKVLEARRQWQAEQVKEAKRALRLRKQGVKKANLEDNISTLPRPRFQGGPSSAVDGDGRDWRREQGHRGERGTKDKARNLVPMSRPPRPSVLPDGPSRPEGFLDDTASFISSALTGPTAALSRYELGDRRAFNTAKREETDIHTVPSSATAENGSDEKKMSGIPSLVRPAFQLGRGLPQHKRTPSSGSDGKSAALGGVEEKEAAVSVRPAGHGTRQEKEMKGSRLFVAVDKDERDKGKVAAAEQLRLSKNFGVTPRLRSRRESGSPRSWLSSTSDDSLVSAKDKGRKRGLRSDGNHDAEDQDEEVRLGGGGLLQEKTLLRRENDHAYVNDNGKRMDNEQHKRALLESFRLLDSLDLDKSADLRGILGRAPSKLMKEASRARMRLRDDIERGALAGEFYRRREKRNAAKEEPYTEGGRKEVVRQQREVASPSSRPSGIPRLTSKGDVSSAMSSPSYRKKQQWRGQELESSPFSRRRKKGDFTFDDGYDSTNDGILRDSLETTTGKGTFQLREKGLHGTSARAAKTKAKEPHSGSQASGSGKRAGVIAPKDEISGSIDLFLELEREALHGRRKETKERGRIKDNNIGIGKNQGVRGIGGTSSKASSAVSSPARDVRRKTTAHASPQNLLRPKNGREGRGTELGMQAKRSDSSGSKQSINSREGQAPRDIAPEAVDRMSPILSESLIDAEKELEASLARLDESLDRRKREAERERLLGAAGENAKQFAENFRRRGGQESKSSAVHSQQTRGTGKQRIVMTKGNVVQKEDPIRPRDARVQFRQPPAGRQPLRAFGGQRDYSGAEKRGDRARLSRAEDARGWRRGDEGRQRGNDLREESYDSVSRQRRRMDHRGRFAPEVEKKVYQGLPSYPSYLLEESSDDMF